jgi:hypothetical protein
MQQESAGLIVAVLGNVLGDQALQRVMLKLEFLLLVG